MNLSMKSTCFDACMERVNLSKNHKLGYCYSLMTGQTEMECGMENHHLKMRGH